MKKIVLVLATLLSGLVMWSPARAVSPATQPIDCSNFGAQGPYTFTGSVGESFTLDNSGGISECVLLDMTGVVTPSGAGYNAAGMGGPEIIVGGVATFTIVGSGTFKAVTGAGGGPDIIINVVAGGGPTGPATVVKGSFDPRGGSCVFNGQPRSEPYAFFVIGFSYAPGAAECVRPNCAHVGWNLSSSSTTPVPANLPVLDDGGVRRHFVGQAGVYAADWVLSPRLANVTTSTDDMVEIVLDPGCRGTVDVKTAGPCDLVDASGTRLTGSTLSGTSKAFVKSNGSVGSCTVSTTPSFLAYQNLDGTVLAKPSSIVLPAGSATITFFRAPNPPQSVNSVYISKGDATLSWTPPTDANGLKYEIGLRVKTLDNSAWLAWQTLPEKQSGTSMDVGDDLRIVNGRVYQFRVRSIAADGSFSTWINSAERFVGDLTSPFNGSLVLTGLPTGKQGVAASFDVEGLAWTYNVTITDVLAAYMKNAYFAVSTTYAKPNGTTYSWTFPLGDTRSNTCSVGLRYTDGRGKPNWKWTATSCPAR